jgi:hypothetical protein
MFTGYPKLQRRTNGSARIFVIVLVQIEEIGSCFGIEERFNSWTMMRRYQHQKGKKEKQVSGRFFSSFTFLFFCFHLHEWMGTNATATPPRNATRLEFLQNHRAFGTICFPNE